MRKLTERDIQDITGSTIAGYTVEEHYIDGFKTGARFMMEILDDNYEDLKPIAG